MKISKNVSKLAKISKIVLMLTITLILIMVRQSTTFGITNPTLDFLKMYKLVDTYTISNTKNGDSGDLLNTKASITLGTDLNSPYITNVGDFKSSEGTITKEANGIYVLTAIMDRTAPNTSHSISIERTFTTGTIDYNIDKSKVTSNYSQLDNYMDYLKEEVGVEVNNASIQAKAKSLTENIVNPYDKAFAIFRFVNTNMTYSLDSKFANKGALSALIYKEGVCQDYAQLFVALCRASGIPARTVIGFRNTEDMTYKNSIDLTGSSHMWPEIYLPSYGWVITEPTEVFANNGVVIKTVSDNILMQYFAKALIPSEHIATSYETGVSFRSAIVTSNYNRGTVSRPTMSTNSNSTLYLVDDAVINTIDTAKSAIENVDNNLTLDNYKKAMNLVYKLDDSVTEKKSLLEKLDIILDNLVTKNPKDENMKELGKILVAIKRAELQTSYSTYDSAIYLMSTLSDSDFGKAPNRLRDRLSIVATKIQDKKINSKFKDLSDFPFLQSKDVAKVWNITFSQLIDEKTVNTDNISMKNSKGQLVNFKASSNGEIISISPISKFELGEQYAVYISNKVLSMNGDCITNGWYFTFEINP
ncbi:transglutaminase-like domain-containing protein [Clostridium bowmanii]|uniref:transglutaminase-like domain-containing protein n=1 Tax=Clostridium bowmanii TaxID=132925 RepID=UPI001C0E8C09|nr:transglutaminase-like domain-containing protein [Clostridium bowmanii]MBU3190637.1 transglutaminase-like domain-containing protein [Clostridium bowmanii]MCA1072533.1 transglutaminase-like domain-containing protein [Clostridium bowmanii]